MHTDRSTDSADETIIAAHGTTITVAIFQAYSSSLQRSESTRKLVPEGTRGLYVLSKKRPKLKELFDVIYVGVGGTGQRSGVGARIWTHKNDGKKPTWTHYSVFEVHDNISGDEILELERFLLEVFKSDSQLINVRFGSKAFKEISKADLMGKIEIKPA